MLRNVMMLSAGGLVLFGKEYAAASTGVALPLPRLLGSLLTALLTKSVNATGMAVRYIELSHTAISLVTDDGSGTTCALFHDVADGAELGRLLAAELLRAFVDAYRGELRAETARTSAFEGFGATVPAVVRGAARNVVLALERAPAVRAVAFAEGGRLVHSTTDFDSGMAVAGNLGFLLKAAADCMSLVGDECSEVNLDGLLQTGRDSKGAAAGGGGGGGSGSGSGREQRSHISVFRLRPLASPSPSSAPAAALPASLVGGESASGFASADEPQLERQLLVLSACPAVRIEAVAASVRTLQRLLLASAALS